MDEVVENAVAVETHTERYDNTDSNLDTSYVLVSAFENEIGIVPVRMLIKTFTDSTQNTLHKKGDISVMDISPLFLS